MYHIYTLLGRTIQLNANAILEKRAIDKGLPIPNSRFFAVVKYRQDF